MSSICKIYLGFSSSPGVRRPAHIFALVQQIMVHILWNFMACKTVYLNMELRFDLFNWPGRKASSGPEKRCLEGRFPLTRFPGRYSGYFKGDFQWITCWFVKPAFSPKDVCKLTGAHRAHRTLMEKMPGKPWELSNAAGSHGPLGLALSVNVCLYIT